eukprot:752414-Hanusia_phi.AAC.6
MDSGMFGKCDPYVMVSYGEQVEKQRVERRVELKPEPETQDGDQEEHSKRHFQRGRASHIVLTTDFDMQTFSFDIDEAKLSETDMNVNEWLCMPCLTGLKGGAVRLGSIRKERVHRSDITLATVPPHISPKDHS